MRLTDAERLAVVAVAQENGISVAELIREAVNEYVEDYREKSIFVR